MEIWDVGIWQNRALKITFLYQISSELRFTIFPNLWNNSAVFPGTSPQKVKKIIVSYGAFIGWRTKILSDSWGHMIKMAAMPIYGKNL